MELSATASVGIDRVLVLPDEVTGVVYLKLALPSPHTIDVGSTFTIDGAHVPDALQSTDSFIVSERVSPTQLKFQLKQTASQTFVGSWKMTLTSYRVHFQGLSNNVPYGFALYAVNTNFAGNVWYQNETKPIVPLSSNTRLSTLALHNANGTALTIKFLDKSSTTFDPDIREYLFLTASSEDFVDTVYQVEDEDASVSISGSSDRYINMTTIVLPPTTKRVPIETGINFVTIQVHAANGNTAVYTLRIERAGPPTWKRVDEHQQETLILPKKVIATDTKIMLSWDEAVDNNSPIEAYEVYMYPNYTLPDVGNSSTAMTKKDPCAYNTTCFEDDSGRLFCKQVPLILRSAATTSLELVGCLSAAMDESFNGYFFRIRAKNSEGWSELSESNKDGFLVAAEKPDTPIPLESRIEPFQIIVRWLEVSFANANGARVTDYRVIRCDEYQSCLTFLKSGGLFTKDGSNFGFTDKPLFAATTYTYTLAAKNLIGWSDSQTIKVTTKATAPSYVQSVTATTPVLNGTSFDVRYSWVGPLHRNGFDIEHYKFELYDLATSSSGGCIALNPHATSPIYEVQVDVDPASDKGNQGTTKYRLSYFGAKPAKRYCALVYAYNDLGYSEPAMDSRDSFSTGPAPPEAVCPNNVTSLQVELLSDRNRRSELKFIWGAPNDNANPITNYTVNVLWENAEGIVLEAKDVVITQVNLTIAPKNVMAHVTNDELRRAHFPGDQFVIQGGQRYFIDIRASNAVGMSSSCEEKENGVVVNRKYFELTTMDPGMPDALADFDVTSTTGTSANMTWSVPYDGDAAITEYLLIETVEICGPGSSRCRVGASEEHPITDVKAGNINLLAIGTRVFHTQPRLRANTKYKYTLQAVNRVGRAPLSSKKIVETGNPEPPTRIGGFTNTSVGKTFTKLQWDYPTDDGGADISKYEVTLYELMGNSANLLNNAGHLKTFVLRDSDVAQSAFTTVDGHVFERKGNDPFSGHTLKLENLEGSTLYRIQVQACNRGDGQVDKCGLELSALAVQTEDACLQGEYMVKTSDAETCEKCTAGTYNEAKSVLTSCKECAAGKSQGSTGQSSCLDCPKGTSTDGAAKSVACVPCVVGTFSAVDGSKRCTACPKGSYQPSKGSTSCPLCELSTFNDLEGMAKKDDCVKCAMNAVTYEEGAVKRSECLCMGGYYTQDDAAQSDDQKVLWVPCVKCTKGAVCVSNKYGHVMDADVGYWTPNETTTHPTKRFYRCPLDGCLGGDHTVGGSKSRCAYGYTGVSCALCVDGMFKKGYKCEPCEASTILPFIILVVAFVGGITLAVWCFRHFIHSKRMRKYSLLYRDVSNLAAIMLSFAQILEGTVGVYSGVEWPNLFSNFWKILNIAGLDFVSMSGISCAAKVDFYLSFLGQMCIPAIVSAYLGVYYLISAAKVHVKEKAQLLTLKNPVKKMQLKVQTAMKIEKLQGRTRRWIVKILILIHTPIARKWMQYNDCTVIEGVAYLKADYSVVCYDAQWQAFSVPMVLVGIIYIIGLPLGLLYLLVRNRNRLDHPQVLDSIGFLYTPYRREAYFWEVEEIFRKMILSGGLILLGDYPALQLCTAVVSAITFHQLHALWKPHYNRLAYFLQHAALTAVEIVYLVGMLLLLKEPVPEGILFGASGGTVGLGVLMLCLAMYITFTKFVKLRKEDIAIDKDYEFQENLKAKLRAGHLVDDIRQEASLENEEQRPSTKVTPVSQEEETAGNNPTSTKAQSVEDGVSSLRAYLDDSAVSPTTSAETAGEDATSVKTPRTVII